MLLRAAVGVLLSVLASTSAWAQPTAQISGTVKDQSGGVLPDADVTAVHTSTGVARRTASDQ